MKKGEIWILKIPFKNGKEKRGMRQGLIIADTETDMIDNKIRNRENKARINKNLACFLSLII